MRGSLHAMVLAAAAASSCVPADEALPLGSAQFTVTGRGSPRDLASDVVVDGWSIHIDRFVLAFHTMTIVNLEDSDQCAYRGRGAQTNVVFDGISGTVVQAFNGIKPGDCTDVGMRLGPPDDNTVVGEGATAQDLVTLASGRPAHALFEATATRTRSSSDPSSRNVLHVSLRFDTETTGSAFGGCRDAVRGVKIRPEARYAVFVSLAGEAFFRDAISSNAQLRFSPFAESDRRGNDDGTVTMDELELFSLSEAPGPFYQLPSGGRRGTFADYVKAQFLFAVKYGNGGSCNGIEPGTLVDP